MKKSIKLIASSLAAITIMSTAAVPVSATWQNGDGTIIDTSWSSPADDILDDIGYTNNYTGWKTVGSNKYYVKNGVIQKSKWIKAGKNRYYLRKNGVMATGSLKIGGISYTFGKNGVLLTDNGHVYDKNGNRLTEKQAASTKSTYVLDNGKLVNNKCLIVKSSGKNDTALKKMLESYGFKCTKMADGKYKAYFPKQLTPNEIKTVISALKTESIVTSVSKCVAAK